VAGPGSRAADLHGEALASGTTIANLARPDPKIAVVVAHDLAPDRSARRSAIENMEENLESASRVAAVPDRILLT
jgi:hypothetical protein